MPCMPSPILSLAQRQQPAALGLASCPALYEGIAGEELPDTGLHPVLPFHEVNRAIMRVLGIETTCDETAASIVSVERSGESKILSNEVLSQIAAHAAYGGVVPEIAARAHVEAIDRIIARAFANADLKPGDIDAVAAAATASISPGFRSALAKARAMMRSIASTWARAAISGTTPP